LAEFETNETNSEESGFPMGYILLEGGAEFGGQMAEPDRRAVHLAGGNRARIRIIPAAAAPDENHRQAGENGMRWFHSLGAVDAVFLPLIDTASANEPMVADILQRAHLIYMPGGFPGYLAEVLAGSRSWEAMLAAHQAGAVIGGSSAGAMILCEHFFDPQADSLRPGLGLISGACILPHHDTYGHTWAPRLAAEIPTAVLIGIDEETGIIDEAPGQWQIYGKGGVTLYRQGRKKTCASGESFNLIEP
jgi:cyanophycinase